MKNETLANKKQAFLVCVGLLVFATSLVLCSCSLSKTNSDGFEQAEVIYVVDGDTLCVQTQNTDVSQKVRLIGIDTPESVTPQEYLDKTGKENTAEGVAASEFVHSLVGKGDTIYLQYDIGHEDKYGRTLAYVWLSLPENAYDIDEVKTKMLNGILLEKGYADILCVKPNVSYAKIFKEIHEQ